MEKGMAEEAVNECIENANRFIRDAEILIRDESYGHAFSILVLALEEIGKAYLLAYRLAKSEKIDSILKLLRKHGVKQKEMRKIYREFVIIDGVFRKKPELKRISNVQPGEKFDWLMDEIMNLYQQIPDKDVKEALKFYDELETRKQEGFYVDIVNGRVIGPKCITKEEALEILEHIKSYFSTTKGMIDMIMIMQYEASTTLDHVKS